MRTSTTSPRSLRTWSEVPRRPPMPTIGDSLQRGTIVVMTEGRYVVSRQHGNGRPMVDLIGIDDTNREYMRTIDAWRVRAVPRPKQEDLEAAALALK